MPVEEALNQKKVAAENIKITTADPFSIGRIGVIGVGAMGRPLVKRLKSRGFDVAAYVRRDETKVELDAMGVTLEPSVTALAKGRDFIVIYVYTDEQARKVVLEDGLIEAMEPGAMLIIHTTASPRTVQDIGARGEQTGVRVVDAGGSWGPDCVALGTMTLMVGGTAEDVARCMPVFETYAYPIHHMGPLGAGMEMKLINNAVLGAHLRVASEVLRIGRDLGLDTYRLLRGLTYCTGGSTAMQVMGNAVTEEQFWEYIGRFLYKDISVVNALADQLGIDLGLIGEINKPLMERLRTQHQHCE